MEIHFTGVCTLQYRRYTGEVQSRRVLPLYIWYGSNSWHPEPCWLLEVFDLGKNDKRSFALENIVR